MPYRFGLTLLTLLLVATACNLRGSPPGEQPLATATGGTNSSAKPAVVINSPLPGGEAVVGNEVLVSATATDAVGITRVQLIANGQIVKTVTSESTSGDQNFPVVLNFTPRSAGSMDLLVLAFRGALASDPAQVTITVRDNLAQVTATIAPSNNVPAIDPNDPTCRALVNVGLNFRTGPGTNFERTTVLAAGTVAPIIGRVGDNSWWQLRVGGSIGWVSSDFTTELGICANIPVVQPPPSPTVATSTPAATSSPLASATPLPTATALPTATPGLPDLIITAFDGPTTVTLENGSAGARYSVTVTNTGSGPTGQFELGITIQPAGTELSGGAVGNLNGGESIVLAVDVTFDTAGALTLRAEADSGAVVTEVSEVNNFGVLGVTVSQP